TIHVYTANATTAPIRRALDSLHLVVKSSSDENRRPRYRVIARLDSLGRLDYECATGEHGRDQALLPHLRSAHDSWRRYRLRESRQCPIYHRRSDYGGLGPRRRSAAAGTSRRRTVRRL